MSAVEFLASLWGADDRGSLQNVHFIAELVNKRFRQYRVMTIADAVAKSLEISRRGKNAYFACADFANSSNRKADNAVGSWSFWLDIDCGADKAAGGEGYTTKRDGLIALVQFCNVTELAEPTIVVDSGNGLHCYWYFDKLIATAEWLPLAIKLKSLAATHNFLADSSRTADIASVLRVPGTYNFKDPSNRKPVEIKRLAGPTNFAAFAAALNRPTLDLGDNLNGVSPKAGPFPPSSAHEIIKQCATLAHVAAARGAVNEPLWRSMLGTIKFTIEGEELCHEWSKGYPHYDRHETQAKIDRWTTGPTRCETFRALSGSHCASCSQICKSPLQLGQLTETGPAIIVKAGAASVSVQAGQVLNAFVNQNKRDPRLFKANTVITRLHHDETGTRLEPLDKDALQHEIDRVVNFVTKTGSHIGVPKSIVSNIFGAPDYDLPLVRGVRRAPYFAADGRLVTQPGYDPGTEYFLMLPQGLVIPTVAMHPTFSQTRRALRQLIEVFLDFPFRDRASKRAYLALLLLPFCRDLIDGSTPIHVIGKPAPGTGASLAVDVFSIISTGRPAAAQAEAESTAEFRKNLTAFLMSGSQCYFIDNIHQSLNDPAFAAALTAGFWQDRILGKSDMVNIPIRNTWIVAGNNPELSEELARRSVLIWFDAQMEDPGSRTKFRHPALIEYVKENRGKLIWACLTLIQAWVAVRHTVTYSGAIGTGDPDCIDEFLAFAKQQNLDVTEQRKVPGTAKLASFETWASTMSGILQRTGVRGLMDNRSKLKERTTDDVAMLREFVALWYSVHKHSDVRIGSFTKGGQGDNYAMVPVRGTLVELLHTHKSEFDLGFNGRTEATWQSKMGATLSGASGRVFQLSVGVSGPVQVRIVKTRGSRCVTYRLELIP